MGDLGRISASGAGVALLVAAMVSGCSGPSDEVRARQIVLVDDEGAERVTITVEGGASRLRLYDDQGRRRAAVAVSDEGEPGLALLDENGTVRAALEMDRGEPRLAFYDTNGGVHRQIK